MAKYDVQSAAGYGPNDAYIPANINAPIIFTPPSELATGSGEIWIAASNPDPNYGGCIVWCSIDTAGSYPATSFHRVGKIYGSAVTGATTTTLPTIATTVDTTNTISLQMDIGTADLVSVSQQSNDTYHSLCRVGSEVLAYRYASLSGVSGGHNFYNLTNLRRGLYGTTKGSASGSRFVFLTDAVFKYRFNQNLVGNIIYFKFQAFNSVEGGLQDLSTLPAYGFMVSASGGIKATTDYVDSSVSTAVSTAIAGLKINAVLNSTVTGLTALKIGALRLPAGTYNAPQANIGCVNAGHIAKLELRNSGGTLLATVGGVAGTVAWRTASAGFTLASATDVDLTIFCTNSVAGVVNIYGLVL